MKPAEKFVVVGGFRDEESAEGYIGMLELCKDGTESSLRFMSIIVEAPPNENLHLPNKGFAGGTIHNKQLWVCTANQVLAYRLDNWQLQHVIDNPLFNDLHHILADDDGLYVVNTGLEAIDYLDHSGKLVKRTMLTSDELTQKRIVSAKEFRTSTTEPHLMHANHCVKNYKGQLLVTLARQRQVLNLDEWDWASPEFDAPPHDGIMAYYPPDKKTYLWVTNVHGTIIACSDKKRIIKSWNLKDYGIPPGWVRGVAVLAHGFIVGSSKITTSNRNYYSGWDKQDFTNSKTTIAYIPFDDNERGHHTDIFPERKATKIFSIIPLVR